MLLILSENPPKQRTWAGRRSFPAFWTTGQPERKSTNFLTDCRGWESNPTGHWKTRFIFGLAKNPSQHKPPSVAKVASLLRLPARMTHKGRVPPFCSFVVAVGDCRQIMLPLCHQLPGGTGNRLRFDRLIHYRLPQLPQAADCVQCITPDVGFILWR
jgi:hypothetical protein